MEVSYKIILIGEPKVGKTSIKTRFVNGVFDPNTLTSLTDISTRKTISLKNGKSVEIVLWDTAGQERYRALTKYFYKDSKAVILVYDITNKNSFMELKDYWYQQVKDNCNSNVVVAFAANKSDLSKNIKVDNEEGENFAKSIGAIFVSTSAKNNTGIEVLFDYIAQKLLDPKFCFTINEETKKEDFKMKKQQEVNKNCLGTKVKNGKGKSQVDDEKEKEIKELKEKLNKANKVIENQKIEIQELKNKINSFKNINNNSEIKNLKNEIDIRNDQINKLKEQLQNINLKNKDEQIYLKDMKSVTFTSTDQQLCYSIPCSGNETFAEIEEKLYKEYPKYREANNTFLANGKEILRFKTINDNKIGTGKPVTLATPS